MKIQFKRSKPNTLKNEGPYYTKEELLKEINDIFNTPGYCFHTFVCSDGVIATKVSFSKTHIYMGEYTGRVSMKSEDFSKDFKLENLITFISNYLEKKVEERSAQLTATKNALFDLHVWFDDGDENVD